MTQSPSRRHRALHLLAFLPVYLWEMVKSNARVALDVLSPRPDFQPGFTHLDLSGYGPTARWAAACLISMTPGTLSLDLEEANGILIVHTLYLTDSTQAQAELHSLVERALGPAAVLSQSLP